MKQIPTYLLLGRSSFLSAVAQQVDDLGGTYWQIQAADLPLFSYQCFPEQSLLLYGQQDAAEGQAFLFYVLSQLFPFTQQHIFAETEPFLAAYLSRYLQAPLYLQAGLLSHLQSLERDWILATPTLRALMLAGSQDQSMDLGLHLNPPISSFKNVCCAEISSNLSHWLTNEWDEMI